MKITPDDREKICFRCGRKHQTINVGVNYLIFLEYSQFIMDSDDCFWTMLDNFFKNCNIKRLSIVDSIGSDCLDSTIIDCEIRNTDIHNSVCDKSTMKWSKIMRSHISNAYIDNSNLSDSTAKGCRVVNAVINNAIITGDVVWNDLCYKRLFVDCGNKEFSCNGNMDRTNVKDMVQNGLYVAKSKDQIGVFDDENKAYSYLRNVDYIELVQKT